LQLIDGMSSAVRGSLGATLLLLAYACGPARPPPFRQLDSTSGQSPATFKATVNDHAMYGAVMRDGVARGDLDSTRHAARELVQLVIESERPVPRTRVGDMVDAARRVEAAEDLREAARAFATLSERCGACHTAFGGPRSFPAVAPPDAVGIGPRMRRHQWGAARLWEGLVAPSGEAWRSGASTLADAPLGFEPELGRAVTPAIEKLTASVHDLGVRAALATSASARAEIYGELMITCADCHRQAGGGPVGPAR